MDMLDLMKAAATLGASDLHIRAGGIPAVRVNGAMRPLDLQIPSLSGEQTRRLIFSVLTQDQISRFERDFELDCSLSVTAGAQYRANVLRTRQGVDAVIRILPGAIPDPGQIGLTEEMLNLTTLTRGLVLVTGPTGSGKTSTLASLLEHANKTRSDHIITIEDPIEYVFESKRCIVRQREVGTHTRSFPDALRAALREDPDILLVGEMRDLETISLAVTAAETGHLCFATLHTQDAASAMSRIVDAFPPHQQDQVRSQLALSLRGVIAQRLLPKKDVRGRVAIRELLLNTPAIATIIRDNKLHLVSSALENGMALGMVSFDRSLALAVRNGDVELDVAFANAHNSDQLKVLLGLVAPPRR